MKPKTVDSADQTEDKGTAAENQPDRTDEHAGPLSVKVVGVARDEDDGADVPPNQAENEPADDDEHGVSNGLPGAPVDDAPFGRFSNGNPRKAPKGAGAAEERAKQRSRLKSVTQSTFKPKEGISPKLPALAIVNYQSMGETAANMFFGVGTMAFGEDWQPDVQEGEPVAVAGAFRDYFKSTGMRDLPPAFALVAVLCVYGMKRLSKPTVKNRLQAIGLWTREALGKLKRSGRG